MTAPFPVIASILSPEAISLEILPGFEVGKIADVKLYAAGFNHTYRVRTAADETYYLRAYRAPWRTLMDILYELDVLHHLKSKGFPAIRPVRYHDGQFYCAVPAPEGTRYLALFTEAPGSEIAYDREPAETARRYGRAVAQMHNALDGFSSPYLRFQLDLAYFTEQPLRYIEPFLIQRRQDWAFVQKFAAALRERLLSLPADALARGFCHGDLQGYHANVALDGALTFYDFDCGGYGFQAYDLAVFLWCCRLQDAVDARWAPFLTGYRETRPVADLEIRAVPLFVCARYLWHIGVHTQNSADWGIDFLNEQYFADHLGRLRKAAEDYLDRD